MTHWRATTRLACITAALAAALAVGGCQYFDFGGSSPSRSAGPVPRATGQTEQGVRTLTLTWTLPKRDAPPALMSWEHIEFRDDAGRVWAARNVHWGRGADGDWTAISFIYPPAAQKITATMTLRIDGQAWPLTAILTRIDPTHWRTDYNVMPAE